MHDARLQPALTERLPTRSRAAMRGLLAIVETVALTAVIFLGIQGFVAQPFKVQLTSMEATLLPGDYVLVDKLTPRWAPYARGDIVVFEPPDTWSSGRGVPFIKRVIGVPGDQVEIRDGKVFVNGRKLDEPYVHVADARHGTEPLPGGTSSWVVPDENLFVMGDHRDASADSRVFGAIELSSVIGRAWLRYWPFDTFGPIAAPVYALGPG